MTLWSPNLHRELIAAVFRVWIVLHLEELKSHVKFIIKYAVLNKKSPAFKFGGQVETHLSPSFAKTDLLLIYFEKGREWATATYFTFFKQSIFAVMNHCLIFFDLILISLILRFSFLF